MNMRNAIFIILFSFLAMTRAAAFDEQAVGAAAEQGFNEILDLWRAEEYEQLHARLDHPPGQGWDYFARRIIYGDRVPACCWEKLQEVSVRALSADQVVIAARVGFEVDGYGIRFVTRDFPLRRDGSVWKLPQWLVLELAGYNFQRIPRKIYERSLE